jgi:diguanylate cyclase (GGDEF)-like protein
VGSVNSQASATATRPLSDPGVVGRIAPFVTIFSIALLLIGLTPTGSFDSNALIAAAVLTAVLVAAALVVPWRRWAAWTEAIVPVAAFVVIVLLRQAEGGASPRCTPLVMLPVIWLAIHGSRAQLLCAIAGSAVTFVAPGILAGGLLHPSIDWGGAGLWAATGLLAGSAIQGLVGQARRRSADVAALGAISRALLAAADPRPELCVAAQVVTGATFAILLEPTPDGAMVATASTDGIDLRAIRVDPSVDVSVTMEVWRTGETVYVADAAADERTMKRLVDLTGALGVLFAPVTRDGRRLAVLVVGFRRSRPRLPEQSLYMIELVAGEIAAALDRAELVALLAKQARTDALTGADNRRSWDEQVDHELARARRTGAPLAVAMIDMDHFKLYNDTYGHSAGDALLGGLVSAIRAELRPSDLIARWGGEEFAIALPDCDLRQARAVASRLLLVVPDGQTMSIGLTEASLDDTSRTLIARADRALYAAKDAGRNRVQAIALRLPQAQAGRSTVQSH